MTTYKCSVGNGLMFEKHIFYYDRLEETLDLEQVMGAFVHVIAS